METRTITEEFINRMDNEMRYHGSLYQKEGEPFQAEALVTAAGTSFPAVDLWHGLWYQGEMACLFGEPNVGKTILAMQIANTLCKRGLKTLYYDFENAAHQLKPRYNTHKYDSATGDGMFHIKSLNPNFSTAKLDSHSVLDHIKKDIINEKSPVIIIDDITHLLGSGNQADVRFVLNTLRSWTQHFLVSILVLAHSTRRKASALTTLDTLAGSFEFSYAFDSIFSLSRANRYNAEHNHITHYIKHHKNRMGSVLYHEHNVITAEFGRDTNNGYLQFNNFYTGGNERQLLRDYGFSTSQQVTQAILQFKNLFYTTREIAAIVGCSQSHVVKTIKKHEQKEPSTSSNSDTATSSNSDTATSSNSDTATSSNSDTPTSSNSDTVTTPSRVVECAERIMPESTVCDTPSIPTTMPRKKLTPDLTPIYDPSQYITDIYGERMTIDEYNQIYKDDDSSDSPGSSDSSGSSDSKIPAIPAIP